MELALKKVPGVTEKNVVPPDLEYDYFQNARDIPFRYESTQYDPVNAWWMAEASLLAYAPPRFAEYALGYKTGLTEFEFFQGGTTEVMIAAKPEFAIIAFRGTEIVSANAFSDIFTDLMFNLVPLIPETQIKVHQGFRDALMETWGKPDGLKVHLDKLVARHPGIKLWFTGHSLGGAMATIAAKLYENHVSGLYTYGSPMVGNIPFVQSCRFPTWRIVHNYDIIVHLPPKNPLRKKEEALYQHLGELHFITAEGAIVNQDPNDEENAVLPTSLKGFVKNRFQKVWKSIDQLDVSILKETTMETADHAPIFYVLKLWNALIKSKTKA